LFKATFAMLWLLGVTMLLSTSAGEYASWNFEHPNGKLQARQMESADSRLHDGMLLLQGFV
jgi:hypothetical protein